MIEYSPFFGSVSAIPNGLWFYCASYLAGYQCFTEVFGLAIATDGHDPVQQDHSCKHQKGHSPATGDLLKGLMLPAFLNFHYRLSRAIQKIQRLFLPNKIQLKYIENVKNWKIWMNDTDKKKAGLLITIVWVLTKIPPKNWLQLCKKNAVKQTILVVISEAGRALMKDQCTKRQLQKLNFKLINSLVFHIKEFSIRRGLMPQLQYFVLDATDRDLTGSKFMLLTIKSYTHMKEA